MGHSNRTSRAIPNGVINSFSTIIIKDLVRGSRPTVSRIFLMFTAGIFDNQNNGNEISRRFPTNSRSFHRRPHHS